MGRAGPPDQVAGQDRAGERDRGRSPAERVGDDRAFDPTGERAAGSIVIMSQYVTHRDERYFPDPLRFDPERWTPEAKEARPQFSYFPFGGGPRRCIGEGFAWMEGVLVIATLAQSWRMRLVAGHPVEVLPVVTLRPKHGMRMTLEQRKGPADAEKR